MPYTYYIIGNECRRDITFGGQERAPRGLPSVSGAQEARGGNTLPIFLVPLYPNLGGGLAT